MQWKKTKSFKQFLRYVKRHWNIDIARTFPFANYDAWISLLNLLFSSVTNKKVEIKINERIFFKRKKVFQTLMEIIFKFLFIISRKSSINGTNESVVLIIITSI